MQWTVDIILAAAVFCLVSSGQLYLGKVTTDKEVAEEGETVMFKCRVPTSHLNESENGAFYLFKDGREVQTQPGLKELGAATFILHLVTVEETGSYSCAYGEESPGGLNITNNKSVSLKVKDSQVLFLHYREKENSILDEDAEFTCLFHKDKRITPFKGGQFELYKDGVLLASQPMGSISATTFKIKNHTRNSKGTYVCSFRLGDTHIIKSPPVTLWNGATVATPVKYTSRKGFYLMCIFGLVVLLLIAGGILICVHCRQGFQRKNQQSNEDPSTIYSYIQDNACDASAQQRKPTGTELYSQVIKKSRTRTVLT
ncbi:uncharacterized protein LOC120536187 isoform X2 [Polypterus senegalus]|uniref:uncharacterized protein LOC120536187 isoform X2 n=1 Tax=Polypterus senegalus TaxID=55291 RepID=UPI00196272B7|nr:uncharacterized protein LOC120536187 isoform X2 [Polypterus senegalus]